MEGRALGVVTTPPPFVPPPAPANLRATVAGNRVSLTWDAPATAPAGYVVEGGVNPGEVLAAIPVAGTPTSFAFEAPTGAFYVRLHAWTASGRSPASNEIRIFVNVPQPPSAPTSLLGLADGANLVLSWQNGSTGGAPTSIILDVSGAATLSMPLPPNETFAFPACRRAPTRSPSARPTAAAPVRRPHRSRCPSRAHVPAHRSQPLNFVVSRNGIRGERPVGSARFGPGCVQLRLEGHWRSGCDAANDRAQHQRHGAVRHL